MERGKLRQIARNQLSQRCFMRILDTDIVGWERKMKIIRECVIDEKAVEQDWKPRHRTGVTRKIEKY